MSHLVNNALRPRLLGLAVVTGLVSQASGCILDPQQLIEQIPGFVQSFALQALSAYLL